MDLHPEQQGRRRIALIAHDNKKTDIAEWARFNRPALAQHDSLRTGTTGQLLSRELGLPLNCLRSGPLGGDQQQPRTGPIGARIADGEVDILIFFWDPLEPQPHDPDVKALLRLAVAWNIPVACNRATADFLISSPLFERRYERLQPDFADYAEQGRAAVTDRGRPGRLSPTAESGGRVRPNANPVPVIMIFDAGSNGARLLLLMASRAADARAWAWPYG